jgi:hypothetical protein
LIKEHAGLSDTDFKSFITEDIICESNLTNQILAEGNYTLVNDIASPKTGEIIALAGTKIIAENNTKPIGIIFGYPQFEVLHEKTNKVIRVNILDLKEYEHCF